MKTKSQEITYTSYNKLQNKQTNPFILGIYLMCSQTFKKANENKHKTQDSWVRETERRDKRDTYNICKLMHVFQLLTLVEYSLNKY